MTGPRDWPFMDAARAAVTGEVEYWRDEITSPWRHGREGRAADIGRWIGLGLAVAAAAAGIAAALRSERPWD